MAKKNSSAISLVGASMLLASCAGTSRSPYATQAPGVRNPMEAQRLTLEAADLLDTDAAQAEALLRNALQADLFFGPAHNNLAIALMRKDLWYDAANEFEWARKLMPGHPDPRMNLALIFERAGRIDDALTGYMGALDVCPEHIPTIEALTRLQIRHHRTDDQTHQRLEQIALAGETPRWRDWAREQLAKTARAPAPN